MTLVVMQPTYIPWLGYFDLLDQSDAFVLLDNVQFEKQSWQQRNRIKSASGEQWLTVPVFQALTQQIKNVRINNNTPWRRKHWTAISNNYTKTPHWPAYRAELEKIYSAEWTLLADLNITLITLLAAFLGIEKKIIRSSQLDIPKVEKVAMLVELAKHFGADMYLSPNGSRTYLTSGEPFAKDGINLRFQCYVHPHYSQLYGEFLEFMTCVDLVMNEGEQALEVIRSGRRAPMPVHDLAGDPY